MAGAPYRWMDDHVTEKPALDFICPEMRSIKTFPDSTWTRDFGRLLTIRHAAPRLIVMG